MGIFKKKHTPQGERKPGFIALRYYLIGGFCALIFISFISINHLSSTIDTISDSIDEIWDDLPKKETGVPWDKEVDWNFECLRIFISQYYYSDFFNYYGYKIAGEFIKSPDAVSTILFFVFVNIITVWLIGGCKFSIIDTKGLVPKGLYKVAMFFMILYLLSLLFFWTRLPDNFIISSFAFALPALFLFVPVYFMIFKELVKETDLYQEWFVEGRGREVARWGSFASYHRHDISEEFREARRKIYRLKESSFYIGKTKFLYDYKLGGRHIGTKSEQHLIIVAGTGSGKSRDILNNNTLTYSGGMIVFDTKGEHVEVSYKKRSTFANTYVVDPWGKNKAGIPTDYWNPLETIDINSDTARARIERICQSIVIKEGSGAERAVDTHFREAPQKILRGYIAHVLSKFPKEHHNFPSIYNLMFKGSVEGESLDPDAVDSIILDMGENDVCEGAPIEAATILTRLQGSEESGVWSTLSRSLDWVNDPNIRKVMSKSGTFSLRECKLNDATVYLVVPENFLIQQRRFIRMFYQVAFDELDEHYTRQPENSKRRVLFIFDEFEVLGHFESARQAALRKRSSFIKCVYVVQNFNQFQDNYPNIQDFLGNCDKVVFGVDRSDINIMAMLKRALGSYTDKETDLSGNVRTVTKELMPESEIASFMNAKRKGQFFIPVKGLPMKLKRAHYDSNFWEHKRGGIFDRYKQAKASIVKFKSKISDLKAQMGL